MDRQHRPRQSIYSPGPRHFLRFLLSAASRGFGPVVSAFRMSFSCFRLIFLSFRLSEICGASTRGRKSALPRQYGWAGRGCCAHHLILQPLRLVLLLSLLLLLAPLLRQLRRDGARGGGGGGGGGERATVGPRTAGWVSPSSAAGSARPPPAAPPAPRLARRAPETASPRRCAQPVRR